MAMTSTRQEMISAIRELPARLEELVGGLSEEQLDASAGEGEWTVRQVVHHLADAHMVGFGRMKLVLTEEHPTVVVYDQEAWAETPDYREIPIEASLQIIRGLHQRWVALMKGLDEGQWARTGFHRERGDVSVEGFLGTYANHAGAHLGQIARLLEAHRGSGG